MTQARRTALIGTVSFMALALAPDASARAAFADIAQDTVAQTSDQTNEPASGVPQPSGQTLDPAAESPPATGDAEIVVTGSRLQLSGFAAPTPTTVIGKDLIDQRAPVSVDAIINRLPAVRQTAGNGQSQRLFASGQAPIDLRALGPVRTLTLVDGNRFTPTSADGTVDSNIIPIGLLERIDVVTGGASAAYGSDAVAGVVNLVLRKQLDGVRLSAQQGVTEAGDASERLFTFAAGTNFADNRGHVIIGGDYSQNDGAGTIYSRDWGRRQPYLVANGANRPAGTPAQSFATNVTYSAQTTGGIITNGPLRGTAFGPDGTPYPFAYGQVLSTLMHGGVNERGNPNGNFPLVIPNQRETALARAQFDVSEALSVHLEGSYGKTQSNGFSGFYQASPIIGVDNPFLPTATRDALLGAGQQSFTLGRLLADYGGTQLHSSHRTLRILGGANGKLFGNFTWEAGAQYGETKNELDVKDVNIANFLAAVNAVRAPDGSIVCGPLPTNPNLTPTRLAQVQPGCVPINVFGLGSPSAESLDYITSNGGSHQFSTVSRFVADLNLRGSPFSTWAGPVQVAVGAEYRRDTVDASASAASLAGSFNASNFGQFSGEVKVKEGYAEVGVPLARDAAFAKSIDVNAAVRVTDYSTSGGVTTWKVGGTWEVAEGLRFRGTRSRDIRAPSLNDLYGVSGSGGLINITNPFNGASGRLVASNTGNSDLVPERADTTTIGAVLEPQWDWARGFKASVDYYNIKINGAITTVAAADVVLRCFQGQTRYCSAITTDNSAFGIANVNVRPYNLNVVQTRGLEGALNYQTRLPGDSGMLNFRVLATHTLNLKTIDQGSVIDRAGAIQSGGIPKWSGTADISFSHGGFLVTLSGRAFSASRFDATLFDPTDDGYNPASGSSINDNRFPSAAYFDIYAEQTIRSGATRFTLYGSVENLANKDPALYAATSITSGGNPYDLLGRRFKIGIRVVR
jgi:iron complex outermembrane receptor protein